MSSLPVVPAGAVARPEIDLRLNGSPHRIPCVMTLLELVESIGCDPQAVAVEVNGDIVRRAHLAATEVAAGDCVEVVRFVQGG